MAFKSFVSTYIELNIDPSFEFEKIYRNGVLQYEKNWEKSEAE